MLSSHRAKTIFFGLLQGGLEIPCLLLFEGPKIEVDKLNTLFKEKI